MGCTVVVDGFFGDTGKGKVISYLAVKDKISVCARAGGGPNAGHTVVKDGRMYKLRMVSSAFTYEKTRLLIGPGVAVNPEILIREVDELGISNRLGVDSQCAIIEKRHIEVDSRGHLKRKIKTTGSGTGPCNAERAMRTVRLASDIPELRRYITDVPMEVNRAIEEGEEVLVEGTQGTFLSLYHGTYPYVTSKDVTASAACADVGGGPTRVDEVILVLKAYVTRVGAGDLPGEIPWEEAVKKNWAEVGTVTGRRRRSAPFNFDLARRAVMLNGATQISLTKVDILDPVCKAVRYYEELSSEARSFIEKIEEELDLPVTLIGTGPDVMEIVDRRE